MKPYQLTNETLKLTMFANDILLFLSGKEDQFERIFTIVHDFAIHCDCKLNMAKCQAFHVGSTVTGTVSTINQSIFICGNIKTQT